jgi:hypothetical protein
VFPAYETRPNVVKVFPEAAGAAPMQGVAAEETTPDMLHKYQPPPTSTMREAFRVPEVAPTAVCETVPSSKLKTTETQLPAVPCKLIIGKLMVPFFRNTEIA